MSETEPTKFVPKFKHSDPLLMAREIVFGRLLKDVPDEGRRWEIATAVANQLDMAKILTTPRLHAQEQIGEQE